MTFLGIVLIILSFLVAKFLYDNLMLRIENDGLKRDVEALKNRIETLEKERDHHDRFAQL